MAVLVVPRLHPTLIGPTIEYTDQYMTVIQASGIAAILLAFRGLVNNVLDAIQPANTDQDNANIPAMEFSTYPGRESAGLRTPLPPQFNTWV